MYSSNAADPADAAVEEGERAGWEGSDVSQEEIDWLIRTRRIPKEVICRPPGKEAEPNLEPG